ncbi:MAG: MotA/TolQ/ExbB proton channel family protein [Kangiellaceae bacterium]|nr:MotA/TolQ/ExbB proton channel family protein [Kangiellaceae bacterium]
MNQNIYESPKSELKLDINKRPKLGKVLSITGGILQAPIVVYFLIGLIDLIQTFQSITLYGEGDPKVMAGGISAALSFLIIGALISIPGLIISIISLFISSYRSKWLFRYSIMVSIFWIVSFPVGTVFGLVYFIIILVKRKTSTKLLNQSMQATAR